MIAHHHFPGGLCRARHWPTLYGRTQSWGFREMFRNARAWNRCYSRFRGQICGIGLGGYGLGF